MSDAILVATRKGFFELQRRPHGWEVSNTAFLGDNCSQLLHDARDGALYVAQALGHFGVKLQRSLDGGRHWQEVKAPAFDKIEGRTDGPSVSYLLALESDGLAAGGLWCGTIPGGLFHSKDGGESWQLNEALWNRPERPKWFGGGFDSAGIDSVAVNPRNARHVTLGISCGGVWQTQDGGANWRLTAAGLHAEYMPDEQAADPNIQDVHRLVQCAAAPERLWVQHHNGVFASRDGGESWHEITAIQPAKFGFAVAVHPQDPDTAWFVPGVKDECRIPVDGKLVVARTRDGGTSFEVLRQGLPQTHAYDLVLRHGLDVDASGQRLVMGSTTGHLWVSENAGDSWTLVGGHLPPIAAVRFA